MKLDIGQRNSSKSGDRMVCDRAAKRGQSLNTQRKAGQCGKSLQSASLGEECAVENRLCRPIKSFNVFVSEYKRREPGAKTSPDI